MEHTYESVLASVMDYLKENLEEGKTVEVKPESHLLRDLNVDSVQSFELVEALEDQYSLTIPLDFFQKVATVDDVTREIMSLLQTKE